MLNQRWRQSLRNGHYGAQREQHEKAVQHFEMDALSVGLQV